MDTKKLRTVFSRKQLIHLEEKLNIPLRIAISGIVAFADSFGQIKNDKEYIKECVFPFQDVDIEHILTHLSVLDLISYKKINGESFIQVFPEIAQVKSLFKTENKQQSMDYKIAYTIWNEFAERHLLPKVIKGTPRRDAGIKRRIKDPMFDLPAIFKEIEMSDFLLGKKTSWKVDFDFIFLSEHNYIKIMEGKYRNEKKESFEDYFLRESNL